MNLKKTAFKGSFFKKYFFTTMLVIILGFSTLGGTFLMFTTRYWEDEKYNLLEKNAAEISNIISENSMILNGKLVIIDNNIIRGFISIFSSNIEADIIITNEKGEILFYSEGTDSERSSSKVSQDIVDSSLYGEYYGKSNLDIYEYERYVVAVPIVADLNDGQKSLGAVFAVTDNNYIKMFRNDILYMLVFASVVALVISFFVIWILSYNLMKPLSEISNAAKRIASGDFSQRVHVRKNDEIGHLGSSFNEMADFLSRSEDTRRSFIANVSHELKTPMTTISGFIDGILDGTIEESKVRSYLNVVSLEVKRLSRLVRTMMNLSKIDSGSLKIVYSRFDLLPVIFNSLLSFESLINEKKISIRGLEDSEPIYVDGDRDMIYQVIYNLIENAVKFTDEGGYIEIKFFQKDDRVIVNIKNSCEGISQNDLKFVFDKFYKTDKSRSQDKNGMGLGLYIVKTIVELHNGKIKVESREGQYCEFEFYIPVLNCNEN